MSFRIACCELNNEFYSLLCFSATKDSPWTGIIDKFKDPVFWLSRFQKFMVLLFIPSHNNMDFCEKEVSAYFELRDVLFRDYLLPVKKSLVSKGNFLLA